MRNLSKLKKLEDKAEKSYISYSNACDKIFELVEEICDFDISETSVVRQPSDGYLILEGTDTISIRDIVKESEELGRKLTLKEVKNFSI